MKERYHTAEAIGGLVEKFGLPELTYQQDWEFEVADEDLAIPLLNAYINRTDLIEDERYTLMCIIIESVRDYMSMKKDEFPLLEELK